MPTAYELMSDQELEQDLALWRQQSAGTCLVGRKCVEIGGDQVLQQRLGITSALQPNLSLALGTSEVTPLEMTAAYATFANGGQSVLPYVIREVRQTNGKVVYARKAAGLGPVKINMVVKRGMNDQEIVPLARHFRGSGHILRFIEFMDVGSSNGWRMDDVIPSAEVIRRIGEHFPLEAIDPNYTGEVAERWRYVDGGGEIGVISSVTQAFCSTCTRARLSTEGRLYTCLFAQSGHDLRSLMRDNRSDAELSAAIGSIWQQRGDRYSEIRTAATAPLRKIEMSYIGG